MLPILNKAIAEKQEISFLLLLALVAYVLVTNMLSFYHLETSPLLNLLSLWTGRQILSFSPNNSYKNCFSGLIG